MSERLPPALDLSPDPPSSFDAWREKVAGEMGLDADAVVSKLARTTADGVTIDALSTPRDRSSAGASADPSGRPGVAPFTRGTAVPGTSGSWTLGHHVDDPRPAEANEALLRDLQLGAQLLWLRVDRAGRLGLDADAEGARGKVGCGGVRWGTPVEIEALLQGVEPRYVQIFVDAGGGTPAAAALFFDWARRRGVPVRELRGGFAFDPLSVLAEEGVLAGGLDGAFAHAARLARHCRTEAPGLRALAVSTRPLHDAGAGPAQQLGFGLAAAVETLRRLEGHGLEPGDAAAQLIFVHSLGSETFLEIARLRAARLLWSKVLKAAGAVSGAAQQMHVVFGSAPSATVVDPWVNLLRSTSQTFSAVVGGADAVIPLPYDRRLGTPSDLARRLTLTTQHVLGEESHLRRVADPAGGSWALESATDALARTAWKLFQRVESKGGYAECLRSGALADELAETVERRRRDIARRKDGLVGLSVFPRLDEERPPRDRPDLDALAEHAAAALGSIERPELDLPDDPDVGDLAAAAGRGATLGALTDAVYSRADSERCEPLPAYRPSAGWERLRLATDEFAAAQGRRPKIFLANLGDARDHRARTEFAAGFFSAAGVEPVEFGRCDHGACCASCFRTARANTGCRVAVLCSSDERYAELAAEAARELKGAGATRVYLAGRPGEHEDAWREAGVDEFIYLGCDALECLQDLLVHLEVLR